LEDWTDLCIRVAAADIDRAGEIALMAAPYGIYLEDYRALEQEALEIAHIDLIDEALLRHDRSVGLVHVYLPAEAHPAEALAFLQERLDQANIAHEMDESICKNEDWENNWKAYFHPLPVGRRLLIQPAWEAVQNPEGRAVVLLEPGLAFGSGSHATTRLCLEQLERRIVPGCQMLDIGCGSGILSIAGVRLGAARALGVDIDLMAVNCAKENAARNQLGEPELSFVRGDLTSHAAGQYDVIVSNIAADVILDIAAAVGTFLAPGGVWICCGIIDARAEEVFVGCVAAGWKFMERRDASGWTLFVFAQNK
jgi:ribosomal protein L11 methyltransferase